MLNLIPFVISANGDLDLTVERLNEELDVISYTVELKEDDDNVGVFSLLEELLIRCFLEERMAFLIFRDSTASLVSIFFLEQMENKENEEDML